VIDSVGQQFRHVVTPLMKLQDPDHSKVLIVTLAETTPVAEANDLQIDLRRAGIEPYGWVVNATLADSGTKDTILMSRIALEQRQLSRVAELTEHVWTLGWSPEIAASEQGDGRDA
jgi:arsenite-transporting ATPase